MQDARRFIDRYGFSWQVCELWSDGPATGDVFLADAAPPTRGWLYFFSRGTTLVLQDYPAAWDELTWPELEGLRERARILGSDTAIRVPRRERRDDAVRSHL